MAGIGSVLLAYFLPNRVIHDSIYSKRKAAEKTLRGQLSEDMKSFLNQAKLQKRSGGLYVKKEW